LTKHYHFVLLNMTLYSTQRILKTIVKKGILLNLKLKWNR
jgi:hypothetical protein